MLDNVFVEEADTTQRTAIDREIVMSILKLHRERRGLQNARTTMTLRIKATASTIAFQRLLAAGEPLPDFAKVGYKRVKATMADMEETMDSYPSWFVVEKFMTDKLKEADKQLSALLKQLPVYAWMKVQKGFAEGSLAAVIGECGGDLNTYSNPAKVWARFGLHVVGNKAARRMKRTADNEAEQELQKFAPRRRAEAHVIGDNLLRAGGEYAALYQTRKAYEIAKLNDAGITVLPAAKIKKSEKATCMSDGQVHKRALRYVEKRLLRNLWREWRATTIVVY